MNNPYTEQVGGNHYLAFKIQPTEFITANGLDWCTGNAIKYLCRHRFKGGKTDLLKAKHYIDMLILADYPDQEVTQAG